ALARLGDERRALVALVDAPAHEHHLVDPEVAAVLLERLAEDEHLDRALEVVEGSDTHPVALLRADLLRRRDDAAGRHPVAVALAGQVREREVDRRAERVPPPRPRAP